jgi:hypothetical protein
MSFDVSRLRRSDWITGGGAAALFVFLFFFKWFGVSFSSPSISGIPGGSVSVGGSLNGWHSLTTIRWLLLLTIIVAVGMVLLVAAQRKLDSPVQAGVIVAGLGALSAIFVLYRIISHPHLGVPVSVSSISYPAKVGVYLGFVALLAITYGGYLKMQEEGTSLSDVRDQAGRAVGSFTDSSASGGGESSSGTSAASSPAPPAAGTSPAQPAPPSEPPLPPPPPSSSGEAGF